MKNSLNSTLQRFNASTLCSYLMLSVIFLLPIGMKAQTFCGGSVTASITSASMSTLFPGGGSWPAGSTIGVSGTLTVDQSTTFNDLDFIMGAGASIVVAGTGVVLTANNFTHFKACRNVETPRMWLGITVANGASIAISDVTVRDAWIGLRFLSTANGTANSISQCYLFNNMFGMGIFSQAFFRPALFANNLIDRQTPDAILPPPSGLSYTGSVLHRGIWITSSTVDLASGASGRNVIGSYRYGIWNFASTVTVANMTFDTQLSDPILTDTIDGTGIFSWRSNLNVGGMGSFGCRFEIPANSGIISRNTLSLSVSGAGFDNPTFYGIRCSQSIALSAPINISLNSFLLNAAFPVSAIYVERPPSGPMLTNVIIDQNRIYSYGSHTKNKAMVMIDVQGKVPAFDATLISDNPIDIGRPWPRINGIRVTGKGWNYQIYNNKDLEWFAGTPTELLQNLQSRGIIASDLMDGLHLIEENTISSTLVNEKSFLRAGLFMDNNPLSLRTCYNVTNSTHKGIECRGNLGSTLLTLNSMGEAAFGLYCENGNTMPDQDRQENLWTASSYFSLGARYNAPSAPFKFFYDPSNAIPNDVPPTVGPSFWFDQESGSEAECGYPIDNTSVAGGGITDYEQDFINGVIEPDTTAKNWDTRHRLLYKLLQLPELLTDNTSASSYLYDNQTTTSSPYRFAQAENLFDQAYTLSPTLAGHIASASAQIQTIGDDIQLLDEQQALDSTTYDAVIAQQRAAAFAQLDSVALVLELFRSQADTIVQQGLQTALTYASALPETMPYEDNLKDILVFAIRSAQGDSLVETDFVRLRQIAAQCPSVGGISVRRAPQWLLHEEGIDYTDKDWDLGCAVTYHDDAKSRINTAQTIQISPNPANERLNVLFPANAAGVWLVSDALGRVVRQGNVDVASLWLDTQDWTPGFYFLVWKNALGRNETVKFIVTH